MIRAPQPRDEAGRARTQRETSVMLTPDEERFDRLTRLVVRLLRVPIALVSLGDARVQWFKSGAGPDLGRTPLAGLHNVLVLAQLSESLEHHGVHGRAGDVVLGIGGLHGTELEQIDDLHPVA